MHNGQYGIFLAYVNTIDGSDVSTVKIPALLGQDSVVVEASSATGWTAPVAGEQRFVAVSYDATDVRWLV